MATAVPSLLFCLVLLSSPYLGLSYHTSYTHDGKHFVLRSNSDPRQPSLPCSAIHAGQSGSDGLPLVHRSNPCSLLADADNQITPSAEDIFRRDAARLSALLGDDPGSQSTASAPASGVDLPSRGDPLKSLPGAFEYHVVAGFGTPVQNFTVGFDTATHGATLLQCKPCATFPEPCNNSFDPSKSSSLAQVPCGSPDCPLRGCSGPSCSVSVSLNTTFLGNATFVTDTLTFSPTSTFPNFRFACLEAGLRTRDSSSGILDLSRNSHSLATRVPHSLLTVAFTYCLPSSSASTSGFLKIAPMRPEYFGHNVSYTPIRSNATTNGDLYFVGLTGLGLGGPDLGVPPSTFASDSLLDLHTTFTYLKPEVYAALRDGFRRWMSGYRTVPPRGVLDTCYDFTGLKIIVMPVITLKFDGGASLDLDIWQMMYFDDPDNVFSVGCLAFAAGRPDSRADFVIGNLAQKSVEVVYDVHAGQTSSTATRSLRTIYAAVRSSHLDAPAPAPARGVTVPVTAKDIPVIKGGLDYSVMVGLGTPAQQLPMDFDT
ncbi:hypothetical protein EJB05_45118, partial [Eragrostis curvula]